MNRADLQALSRARQAEARLLLRDGRYAGSYYLCGYSVECALKASVAKLARRYEFPDRDFAQQAFTHRLDQLLKIAGLDGVLQADSVIDPQLHLNWNVVNAWRVEARYNPSVSAALARDMYGACTARQHGVLRWIRRRW
jgi:HEPN domain-containing protein